MSKQVLILGSNGLLGRHLIKELIDYDVVASDIQSTSSLNVPYHQCDLTRPTEIMKLHSDVNPEIIIFCVGIFSTQDRRILENVNAHTFLNLMNEFAEERPRVFVISSASVYGRVPVEALPLNEDYEGIPSSNYGLSKYVLESYANYFENVTVIRPSNFLGRGLSEHLLAGKLVKETQKKDVIELFNLSSIRDFIDIRDFCSIVHRLLELPDVPSPINISSGVGTSVGEIVKTLEKVLSKKLEVILTDKEPDPRYKAHVQNDRRLREFMKQHGLNLDEIRKYSLQDSLQYMVENSS